MGFIAEVHLAHDELPLVPTIARRADATLRYEYATTTADGQRLQFVSVLDDGDDGDGHDVLEAAMADDPTVSEPTLVATF